MPRTNQDISDGIEEEECKTPKDHLKKSDESNTEDEATVSSSVIKQQHVKSETEQVKKKKKAKGIDRNRRIQKTMTFKDLPRSFQEDLI